MTTRKFDVLAALAVGCAAGWALCYTTACGTARADTTTTVQCDMKTGYATQAYPGMTDADIAARVTAFARNAAPDVTMVPGATITGSTALVFTTNGSALAKCGGCNINGCSGAASVDFTLH